MKKLLFIFLIPIFSFTQSGDTNGDGIVNLEDLFNVLENWLEDVNDNDPEAISNLDEMTDLVDSLITLNHNMNYGLSIEGWIDNDYQSSHSDSEPIINTAQSSGIVLIHGCNGTVPLHQISINGQENIYDSGVSNSDGITTSFPVKIGDEFTITHYCAINNPSGSPSPTIYFFSFGDSNVSNNNQSNSNNSSLITTNYLAEFNGVDCEGLDSLEVGTIVHTINAGTNSIVRLGKKCEASGVGMFTPSGNPNNDASSTAYYLSRRHVLYCFTVNDTIAIDAPGFPSSTICNSGYSVLSRLLTISDSYINFDPNSDYQAIGAGYVLLPGILYLWEHGNINCGSTNANLVVVSPNLTDNAIFNQVSIWAMPLGESTWTSANYITNTYGLYFYEFGKYLKSLN